MMRWTARARWWRKRWSRRFSTIFDDSGTISGQAEAQWPGIRVFIHRPGKLQPRALPPRADGAALPGEDRESGFIRHDLDQVSLAEAIDDARSLSLFASRRLVWLARAEAALPRGEAASSGAAPLVADYVRQPT